MLLKKEKIKNHKRRKRKSLRKLDSLWKTMRLRRRSHILRRRQGSQRRLRRPTLRRLLNLSKSKQLFNPPSRIKRLIMLQLVNLLITTYLVSKEKSLISNLLLVVAEEEVAQEVRQEEDQELKADVVLVLEEETMTSTT